jgi:hypothetical protein
MKSGRNFIGGVLICLIGASSCAQEAEEVEIGPKNISKEVRMEDENGVMKLTIVTTEDGKRTEEVYTGAEAEKKMAEMESEDSSKSGKGFERETKEIDVTEADGKSKVKVTTTVNGVETVEMYEGAEADKKIEEFAKKDEEELIGVPKKKIVKKKIEVETETVYD